MPSLSIPGPWLRAVLVAWLAVASVASAHAHFIWVQVVDGKVHVTFGEGLAADQAALLEKLDGLQGWTIQDGKWVPVVFHQEVSGSVGSMVSDQSGITGGAEVACEYGVISRGELKMWLHYGARSWLATQPMEAGSGNLPLTIHAEVKEGKLHLQSLFQGAPMPGCSFLIAGPDGKSEELVADADGKASLDFAGGGHWLVRVSKAVPESGTLDGEDFSERKYWSTLTIDTGLPYAPADKALGFAPLPTGLTSFGAAVNGQTVLVFGGQMGGAHSYSREQQNGKLLALDLESPTEWKVLGETTGAQGLAVVAHGGQVYRIGGFEARNAEGEEQNLHSVSDFAVFEPEQGNWKKLAELPEPRSSLDACLIGDSIYVAGGWNMRGSEETVWSSSAVRFDLKQPENGWASLPEPPFRRRAVALAGFGDRLFVIGGMEEDGSTSRKVDLFDPATQSWSEGPELPDDGRMGGFGCAALATENQLLVTTYGGSLLALAADGKSWEKVHQLESPRFFHRMVSGPEGGILMIGGTNMESGHLLELELIQLPAR